jgi:hypothetical protein
MRIFVVVLEEHQEKVTNGKWFEMKDEDKEEIEEILKRKGCLDES